MTISATLGTNDGPGQMNTKVTVGVPGWHPAAFRVFGTSAVVREMVLNHLIWPGDMRATPARIFPRQMTAKVTVEVSG